MATQAGRTEKTRAALIEAGWAAFAANGYEGASTPEIAEAAGVSRGALYHHFKDKKALFRAVLETMQGAVLAEIESAAGNAASAVEALKGGALAWLEHASTPDFIRIVMIDGPSVLGLEEWRVIDQRNGVQSLEEGLAYAKAEGALAIKSTAVMAAMLSGALNDAALLLASADSPLKTRDEVFGEFCALIDGLRP